MPTIRTILPQISNDVPLLRVAAYCRVSSDSDDQLHSFAAQTDYYTKLIGENPLWTLVDIYADEGISGTSTAHRDAFNQMIADAKAGKIDLIITKNVSRFARNVGDFVTTVRMLAEHNPRIGVFFESENIFSLKEWFFKITNLKGFSNFKVNSL
jgi:DNA invertase Pin-like site-specific DNA recombinase